MNHWGARLRDWLDRMSLYLPVLLMGLLALGSYWLVRTTPAPTQAEVEQPLRHEPDYFMRQFSVQTFDDTGRLQSEVRGREGRHYPDTDTLEIDQVQIRSYNAQGRMVVATADRALSNADASEVQLFGNAVVVREAGQRADGAEDPRLEFRGDFLHAFVNSEQVRSHLPVELIRGRDRFTGDSMDFDNLARRLDLRGRVHGRLQPAATAPDPKRR